MARDPKSGRPRTAPGASKTRTRTTRSATSSVSAPTASAISSSSPCSTTTAPLAPVGGATRWVAPLTLRAGARPGRLSKLLATLLILFVLAVSYTNSLRIMLNQQRDLAESEQKVAAYKAQVTDLTAALQRWNDPAYVKSQARSQLGWVMPGETGYRVIGLDGKVLAEEGASTGIASSESGDQTRWWDRLAGSVQAADATGAVPDAPR